MDVTILTSMKARHKCQVKPMVFSSFLVSHSTLLHVNISSQLPLNGSVVASQKHGLLISMFVLPHLAAPVFLELHISPRSLCN